MESHAKCVATGLASSLLAVMRGFVLKCGSRCIGPPSRRGMAELVNLRIARKRAKKRQDDLRADTNRLAHGQPKHRRKLEAAQQAKASRDLDRHRIDKGDGR